MFIYSLLQKRRLHTNSFSYSYFKKQNKTTHITNNFLIKRVHMQHRRKKVQNIWIEGEFCKHGNNDLRRDELVPVHFQRILLLLLRQFLFLSIDYLQYICRSDSWINWDFFFGSSCINPWSLGSLMASLCAYACFQCFITTSVLGKKKGGGGGKSWLVDSLYRQTMKGFLFVWFRCSILRS